MPLDIGRRHQQHVETALHAAQTIALAVDRRVERTVAAQGDQPQPARLVRIPMAGRRREMGLAVVRLPNARTGWRGLSHIHLRSS
jgi:hypothetical protein